ncbi:MAG: DUF3883 domain-containing protein [Phycicoccus sp.]|nr:DUF3883 domain-containing protein [Phycicoccus sp.]
MPAMGSPAVAADDLVERLLAEEVDALRLLSAHDQRPQALRSLDERGTAQNLVRQQYTGRYPFELLQNANDAVVDAAGKRKVKFVLTQTALLVGNTGRAFAEDEVRAICSLGRSSKDPRKSIGYKGLGFKSVGEITTRPQVYSPPYHFGFDADQVTTIVTDAVGPLPAGQHLPVYAFPIPLTSTDAGDDAVTVQELLDDDFVTVMRLPLADDVARSDVQQHLKALLQPELLLLLDATDGLELVGSAKDFVATRSIPPAPPAETVDNDSPNRVSLTVNGHDHHWLVFRRRHPITDPNLLQGLGEAWAHVTSVSTIVAVPLADNKLVDPSRPRPLHVYFPAEDTSGCAALLHADFALDLDRRHISRTPEATGYNGWLVQHLADHIAAAAERLARLQPGDPGIVALFAPRTPSTGMGQELRKGIDAALRTTRFIAGRDHQPHSPHELSLLPVSLHDETTVTELLDLPTEPVLADLTPRHPDRDWLLTIGASNITEPAALQWLRNPDTNLEVFYRALVTWADRAARRSTFEAALTNVDCVHLTSGAWGRPSDRVFFPRERDEPDLPDDLPISIAALPPVPRLDLLLEAAGVRRFRWRELLLDQVLPWLTDPDTNPALRVRAHGVLRAYFATDPRGDQEVLNRTGDVLLPAADRTGGLTILTPARRIYFPSSWTGNDDLEQLYGPFGHVEFLAIPPTTNVADHDDPTDSPPDPPPTNTPADIADHNYLAWLGVRDHPRLERADRTGVRWANLDQHPHARAQTTAWHAWLATPQIQQARQCDQGHPESQQLRRSYTMDRLPDLIATRDPQRLMVFSRLLAQHWTEYAQGMRAEINCLHGNHRGGNPRSVPSLLNHLLSTRAWLPANRAGELELTIPSQAWRAVPDMSKALGSVLALLPPELDGRAIQCWADLGVVDAARPSVHDLVDLLHRLAKNHDPTDSATSDSTLDRRRAPLDTARWAMRQLNEDLTRGDPGADDLLLKDIPLLAQHGDTYIFDTNPYLCQDPMLAETWQDIVPILSADRDIRTLASRLRLRRLEDVVTITAQARGPLPERSEGLLERLRQAAPYLAAAALENAPASRPTLLRWLSRLEVVACDELVLAYGLNGQQREREEATTYIEERIETRGRRRRIGTVYLEVPDGADPDWFSLGPQLAEYLEVGQRDAFALLLQSNDAERRHYLRSRGISEAALEEAARELQVELLEPEIDLEKSIFLEDQTNPNLDEVEHPAGTPEDEKGDGTGPEPTPTPGPTTKTTRTPPELPPLDPGTVQVEEGPDLPVVGPERGGPARATSGTGTTIDWDRVAASNRATGRRGEQWVYQQERARVQARGLDPDKVLWQSHLDETSNYDIRSLDDDGHPLYIEVKATAGSDLHASMEISNAELSLAMAHRYRYMIYRVLDANSARPRIVRFRDPIGRIVEGHGAIKVTGAKVFLSPREDPQPPDNPETATSAISEP